MRLVNFGDRPMLYVQLYPNPASTSVVVRTVPDGLTEGTVTLLDVTGRKLSSAALLSSGVQTLSTANLVNGTYLVQVQTNGYTETKELIIRK